MKLLKYIYKFFFSRFFLISTIVILQLVLIFVYSLKLFGHLVYLEWGLLLFYILNFFLVLYIINHKDNPAFRLAWIALIVLVPVFGGVVYLMFANNKIPKDLRRDLLLNMYKRNEILSQNKSTIVDQSIAQQFDYVSNYGGYPYYRNTASKYFSSGLKSFESLKRDLNKAKEFIMIEFFIIRDGLMYQELKEILAKKVKQGVEVYVTYDDIGSYVISDFNLYHDLKEVGVKVAVFNPVHLRLMILSKANNRDHRKIVVIDNKVAYMGSFNIADEYIDLEERFGKWLDCGVRIEGEAVKSLTAMFIQFFNACSEIPLDYESYCHKDYSVAENSFVLPFSDSPTDDEDVAYTVHLNLINQANSYIYIETPYLILDDNLRLALINAVKRGVDVRIIVPHIPDKKTVFQVTRGNCAKLVEQGIRVYEYTPGFIHNKQIIVDDKVILIGSINMDFRSYFLHYECGILLTNQDFIKKAKKDYRSIERQSQQISNEEVAMTNVLIRLIRSVLSIFSPLM